MLDRRRPGALSAFELVSRAALERTLERRRSAAQPVRRRASRTSPCSPSGRSTATTCTGVEDDVDAAFAAGLLTDGRLVDPASAWGLRHRVSESLRTLGVVLGHDVSVPRSSLMDVRQRAIDAVAALAPDAVMCDFGHAGDGGLHLNVLFPTESGPPTRRAAGGDPPGDRRPRHRRRRQLQRRARPRPAQRRALAGHHAADRATPRRRRSRTSSTRTASSATPPTPTTASDAPHPSVSGIGVFALRNLSARSTRSAANTRMIVASARIGAWIVATS